MARHRSGDRAADVVVMAEGLHERDYLGLTVWGGARVEYRHGDAQVGQVADAALGQVHVVVEEHVAGPHGRQREVTCDRMDEGAVGAPGELAQQPVVNPGAEVVRIPDHRRPRRPPDRGLDLLLDGGQAAGDDLQQHRVHRATRTAGEHRHLLTSGVVMTGPPASCRTRPRAPRTLDAPGSSRRTPR